MIRQHISSLIHPCLLCCPISSPTPFLLSSPGSAPGKRRPPAETILSSPHITPASPCTTQINSHLLPPPFQHFPSSFSPFPFTLHHSPLPASKREKKSGVSIHDVSLFVRVCVCVCVCVGVCGSGGWMWSIVQFKPSTFPSSSPSSEPFDPESLLGKWRPGTLLCQPKPLSLQELLTLKHSSAHTHTHTQTDLHRNQNTHPQSVGQSVLASVRIKTRSLHSCEAQ